MEEQRRKIGFGNNNTSPNIGTQENERHSIENDGDTLEPFVDDTEHREVNPDNPTDLAYWAEQFQIPLDELKAVIVLNGNSVKAIKKYLSV